MTETASATGAVSSHQETPPHSTNRYQPLQVDGITQQQQQQFKSAVQTVAARENQLLYGLEISQAIQNLDHAVPLIAKKPTLVRAYLKFSLPNDIKIGGALRVSWRANAQSPFTVTRIISSTDYLKLRANSTPSLKEQREDLQKSLNFVLPDAVIQAGECRIQLVRLSVYLPLPGSSYKVSIPVSPSNLTVKQVRFQQSPPLRLRVLGIRYQKDGNSYEPSGIDYALIQSWLKRAYPINALKWSQGVVAAPEGWSFDAGTVNALIRGIRTQDVADGVDARTHYYGLVSDAGGFMRGLASGIPDTPDPSTVASGPTGPNWGWDTDGSYGDWYTGHELGHTFGRYHAEFCGAAGGRSYPFENGQLSNADGEFVGLDFGDASHNIPRQALPGVDWHDVMSYCEKQWLSSFTYTGILERLIAEDGFAASPKTLMELTPMSDNNSIHVLATLNLTQKSGKFQHVTASRKLAPNVPETSPVQAPDLKLRLYSSDEQLIGEFPVHYYPDACRDENADETGIVDVIIPSDPNGSTLELVLAGQVIDTFSRTTTAKAVRDIRSLTEPAEPSLIGSLADTRTIAWTDESTVMGISGVEVAPGSSYIVQISQDNGETWQTVGYDLNQTNLELDSNLVAGVDEIQVRVTSTDGFTSQTVTQTLEL